MAGRPVRRAALAAIAGNGGINGILERISQGQTITEIAKDLGISRALLSELLNAPAHRSSLTAARALAASALVEQCFSIADAAQPGDVQCARLRCDIRMWAAARWSRSEYGTERIAPGLIVNLAGIHADTLRQIGAEERAKRAKEIEAQVIARPAE